LVNKQAHQYQYKAILLQHVVVLLAALVYTYKAATA